MDQELCWEIVPSSYVSEVTPMEYEQQAAKRDLTKHNSWHPTVDGGNLTGPHPSWGATSNLQFPREEELVFAF